MIIKKHAQVEFIKGYNRTCIYDIPRGDYDFIPNYIADLFLDNKYLKEKDVDYSNAEIKYWFNFLLEKEYIFRIPKKIGKRFIDIDRHFISPNKIEFAIVEIAQKLDLNIFKKLESLICRHITLLILDEEFSIENILYTINTNCFFESINIIHNKDYSVVKTFSASTTFGAFLFLKHDFHILLIMLQRSI